MNDDLTGDAFAGPQTAPTGHEAEHHPAQPTDDYWPCQCACGCGRNSGLQIGAEESVTSVSLLRCEACIRNGHGSEFSKEPTRSLNPTVRTRYVPNETEREWDRIAAEDIARDRRTHVIESFRAQIPERWLRKTDDEPINSAIEERLQRMRNGHGQHNLGILIYGPYGSGKTWTAYSYLLEAVTRGLALPNQIRYGTEGSLLDPIVNGGFKAEDNLTALTDNKTKMLLIDDIGQMGEFSDKAKRHNLYGRICDWAYANEVVLIMTTNKKIGATNEVREWVGDIAYERMTAIMGRPLALIEPKRFQFKDAWEADYQAQHGNNQQSG